MKSINPQITYDGNAREALDFYQGLFGGESEVIPVGDRDHLGLRKDAVFHSDLKGSNYRLMAADAPPSEAGRISLHILCEDRDEIERYFEALADGGSVHCALCAAFGGLFATVTDRFGVNWFLTLPDEAPDK